MEKNIKIGDKTYRVASDDNYLAAMGDNFEPHMVRLFRALIGRDEVVADIGANIGLTALLFSSLARKVYAFEPSPSTYEILRGNLARAGVSNVEAINLGLGHQAEALTITFAGNNRSGGYVSDKIRPEIGHVTEEIRLDTIDHYFAACESVPSFLKIDVEGFEQNVIKGGSLFLQKNMPTVVLEMNHFCLDVLQRITVPDFLDFMRSVFPCLYAIDTDNATIVDLHDAERAYFVMHEHVVRQRFPNLVGGYNPQIKTKLDALAASSTKAMNALISIESGAPRRLLARLLSKATGKTGQGKPFQTPVVARPNGALRADLIPACVSAGEVFEIPLRLSNKGTEAWHGYGSQPVVLSYHWQNLDGGYLIYDGVRTGLQSKVVRPGKSVQEKVSVVAPSEKGNFNLILTVVQEGVGWFENKGFTCANGTVAVV
ncbi:MAG: FkbM family methyltransferase [Desulfurivibrionaceae bacterium]